MVNLEDGYLSALEQEMQAAIKRLKIKKKEYQDLAMEAAEILSDIAIGKINGDDVSIQEAAIASIWASLESALEIEAVNELRATARAVIKRVLTTTLALIPA